VASLHRTAIAHLLNDALLLNLQEIKVRPKDIKLALGEASGQQILGKFEVQDLVMLDPRTYVCVACLVVQAAMNAHAVVQSVSEGSTISWQ